MASSSKADGTAGLPPGLPEAFKKSADKLAAPSTFCIYCCQFFKKGEQTGILPAITWVPIMFGGLPVSVPTCINHLDNPNEKSTLIH